MKYQGVQAFLGGIRPIVVGLIVATGLKMALSAILAISTIDSPVIFDWKALVIFAVVAITHVVYKKLKNKAISPIILILISAGLGMLLYGVL